MKRILIVDDEESIRSLLQEIFSREGYETLLAPNGKKAMELFKAHTVDLVITDIVMPEKEGLETIREIRAEDPDIPVIAMSGGGQIQPDRYLQVAQMFGADEIVEKPIGNNAILDLVEKCLKA